MDEGFPNVGAVEMLTKEEPIKRISKERYIELTKIATSIVDYARMHGVDRREGCILREIAERYFNL